MLRPLFFTKNLIKLVDNIPKWVYNKNIERRKQKINAKHWKGENGNE